MRIYMQHEGTEHDNNARRPERPERPERSSFFRPVNLHATLAELGALDGLAFQLLPPAGHKSRRSIYMFLTPTAPGAP